MKHSIEGSTLRDALTEAMNHGFSTIETEAGTHPPIAEYISEIDSDAPDCEDYVLFGHFIIRVTDAWDWNAEVYTLD